MGMSLFARFTGSAKTEIKAKGPAPGGKPLQAAVRVRPVAKAEVTVLRQPAQRQAPEPMVYRQFDELPAWTNVASQEGGKFERSAAIRAHMFILELAEPSGTFAIVTGREHYGASAYKQAISDISAAGFKVDKCGIADGALIQRIYSNQDRETKANEATNRIIREIDALVQAALDMNVSDIHIESRGNGVQVRMRVNGRLQNYSDSWSSDYVQTMARAMQVIADDESKGTSFSNDAQMSVSRTLPSGQRVKLRVQNSPAYPDDGIDITIRVLRVAASANVKTLEALGYAPDHIAMLEYMLSSPHGLIVIAGTTGSGKSTTLQTAMANIRKADPGRKLISIEDPPEYVLEGVTQIPVARRKEASDGKNPFAAAMRNTMRMDPDVIMIGEIRDPESAGLMVTMNQSGHKVLTTIHAESALGIIGRLRGMGVQSDVLASRGFISGLVFQTLVPTLCEHCRIDYDPGMPSIPEALHERIRQVVKPGDTLFVESPSGCPKCKGSGISGRTVCAEMVIPSPVVRDNIMDNDMKSAHNNWRAQRKAATESMLGASALDHAILKMRRGEVSPAAVEGALGLLHDFSQEADLMAHASEFLGLSD